MPIESLNGHDLQNMLVFKLRAHKYYIGRLIFKSSLFSISIFSERECKTVWKVCHYGDSGKFGNKNAQIRSHARACVRAFGCVKQIFIFCLKINSQILHL